MIRPDALILKSGVHISVSRRRPAASITLYAPPSHRDPHVPASGLGAFQSWFEPGDGNAEFSGMPVEVVRAFCKLHGGVAQAGEEALALLKLLPSQADPHMGEPAAEQPPAVKEAAPDAPLADARGASLAGRSETPVAPRANGQHAVEPAPRLVLDELTQAVIEARKAVADFEGPVAWKKSWGKHRPDWLPETAARWKRVTRGSGLASRLIVVTQPRYSSHPLVTEGAALRGQLQRIADEAQAEIAAKEEADMAYAFARNEDRRRGVG